MTIYAVANQKGGVGKTTTVWMLARQWSCLNRDVLLIDLDPQAHLTRACDLRGAQPTIGEVLGGAIESTTTLLEAMRPVKGYDHVYCVPSSLALENVALGLQQNVLNTITAMADAIATQAHTLSRYEILIDCPPSAGVLTINALMAADYVLIPSSPEPWDIDGVQQMVDVAQQVQRKRGGSPQIAGIVATKTDERTVQHQEGLDRIRDMSVPLIGQIMRRNGRDADNQIFTDYQSIAKSLIQVVP
jgi:chromosome partitioning protein